tara:strand:+ start:4679 stop:5563 length:885 start_codon:yes stop_codon:yes gene_type:complete
MKLIKNEGGYSFYENPDKDLVEKIKNYPKPIYLVDWFTFNNNLGWKMTGTNIAGKPIMESTEGDMMTISLSDYNDLVFENHLRAINNEFLISDTFNKHIAPLKNGTSIITGMTDKYLQNLVRKETFYCGVNSIFISEEWGTNVWDTNYYNGTKTMSVNFSIGSGNGNGHMYFNENGEIVNRDYNRDLNISLPFISKEDSIKEFIVELTKKLPETIEKCGNTYYMLGYGIKIKTYDFSISVKFTPEQSPDVFYVQGESAYTKFKKPKKGVVEVSNNELIDEVSRLLHKEILKEII